MKRKIQIGIMGSAADLKYSKEAEAFAKKLGRLIAKDKNTLIYGAEKDCCSLSTIAAKETKDCGGITVGVTYGKDKTCWNYDDFCPTILLPCGMERGGGREFTLVLSCDVIIAIGGGSGTLNEMVVAYQAGIPIVVVDKFDGWAKDLCNKYIDDRKRFVCVGASNPKDAYQKALKLVNKWCLCCKHLQNFPIKDFYK